MCMSEHDGNGNGVDGMCVLLLDVILFSSSSVHGDMAMIFEIL